MVWLILMIVLVLSVAYGGWWWLASITLGLVWIGSSLSKQIEREPSPEELRIRELVREKFGDSATLEFQQDGVMVEYDSPASDEDGIEQKRLKKGVSWSWFMRAGVDLPFVYTREKKPGTTNAESAETSEKS